jgi:hypothetical protein
METITEELMAILVVGGFIVAITYLLLSLFSQAIFSWIIVLITVFTVFIYEVYDINTEKRKRK